METEGKALSHSLVTLQTVRASQPNKKERLIEIIRAYNGEIALQSFDYKMCEWFKINALEAQDQNFRELFEKTDICVNLIGILFEKKSGNTFKNIHSIFPSLLAKLSKEYNLKHFIHLSALGINEAKDSNYAFSKLEGENQILKNFPLATILRPSVVYSVDDNFTTNFMTLLNRLPLFPLYYEGKTKFSPIHCSDLTDTIYHVISKNIYSKIIECGGPEILTLKEIIRKLLNLIGKKRILLPLPFPVAKLTAKIFELLPTPLITQDQLRLLKYDNILSGKYKTNSDIGIPSVRYFDEEVKKYCYMWREGGQFSTEKYTSDAKLNN